MDELTNCLHQGSAILSESVRNRRFRGAWNRYRNRIMPIPGIGIGLGIGPVLDKVSVSESGPKILKSGPILCKYRYKRSLLSYLWTSPYKGKGINIRIYQQLPESKWSRNRPEMVRIGIGIESCPSLESVSVSESVQCWTRYQYRNRDRKSWYR